MRKRILTVVAAVLFCSCVEPEPFGPVPTQEQVAWQRMEINMFCHFGPNTFTGAEWGDGKESEELFNPTSLDCGQWVEVASKAGMGGIILTAKHHDGFCLWPSRYSNHTVAQSPWRDGKGDVLHELRAAIDNNNSSLKMGVYISPWDRNHPTYGTPDYNEVFANTLKEVHTAYGPIFEQWFDGACGEGPNGKRQEYDWHLFENCVNDITPGCVIFSDVGPGCRWVGNEEGYADETNWSLLKVENGVRRTNHGGCGDKPDPSQVTGHRSQVTDHSSLKWIPAEVDVSIRPGWFWHADEHPKSVDQLMEIYFNSVGRNGLLLLNVPPDNRGLIPAEDSAVLVAFYHERDRIFKNDLAQGATAKGRHLPGRRYKASNVLDTAYNSYWAAVDTNAMVTITFDSVTKFDLIMLQEYIPLGQRVTSVSMLYSTDDNHPYDHRFDTLCTTVGYKRLVRLDEPIRCRSLILTFSALAPPVINRIAFYKMR